MCERECDCKTCDFHAKYFECGDCYMDSLEQCRAGGIHNCRGYIPQSFIKRFWWCLTGRLYWWQL